MRMSAVLAERVTWPKGVSCLGYRLPPEMN